MEVCDKLFYHNYTAFVPNETLNPDKIDSQHQKDHR